MMIMEATILFFVLVAGVAITLGLTHCFKAWRLANTLAPQNLDLLRELKQVKESSLYNVRAAREERNASQRTADTLGVALQEARRERDSALDCMGDTGEVDELVEANDSLVKRIGSLEETGRASQRSVDSLGNALKEARARENTLLRRVKKMQELQQKLGNSLEIIYTDLKLREES